MHDGRRPVATKRSRRLDDQAPYGKRERRPPVLVASGVPRDTAPPVAATSAANGACIKAGGQVPRMRP
jgi:hypothetical protein